MSLPKDGDGTICEGRKVIHLTSWHRKAIDLGFHFPIHVSSERWGWDGTWSKDYRNNLSWPFLSRIWTCNFPVVSPTLYRLSYQGSPWKKRYEPLFSKRHFYMVCRVECNKAAFDCPIKVLQKSLRHMFWPMKLSEMYLDLDIRYTIFWQTICI